MRFEFTDSADKHDVPRPDAEYAVMHHVDYEILQPRRPGEQSFMFVGLPHPQALRYLGVTLAQQRQALTGLRIVASATLDTDPAPGPK